MWKELEKMYEENLKKGMNENDAYAEAYSVICNKYYDTDMDRGLDGRNC